MSLMVRLYAVSADDPLGSTRVAEEVRVLVAWTVGVADAALVVVFGDGVVEVIVPVARAVSVAAAAPLAVLVTGFVTVAVGSAQPRHRPVESASAICPLARSQAP